MAGVDDQVCEGLASRVDSHTDDVTKEQFQESDAQAIR